ncbi:CMRF35-like molecule 9 [Hypomesus transpacificus]|uniref:CMRF35-like molecule 9 n=1 Tax=Hypomesus transpacificus TaxID=137520 RepID=UPI001F07AB12|nr:CMRF35-like molecule 9 [Hypomesus transpacificus]
MKESSMLAVICLLSAPSCRGSECVVMGRKVVGGTASILCSYKPEQKDFKKYFSKGTGEGKVGLLHHQKPSSNGRYKLHDDTEKGRFTVTMADLTPEDSGTYRCGVGQESAEWRSHLEHRPVSNPALPSGMFPMQMLQFLTIHLFSKA